MGTTAAPADMSEAPKSLGARLVGVFFSPGETFEDIARKPDFIVPLIVLMVFHAAMWEGILWKVGIDRYTQSVLKMSSKAVPPEQMKGVEIGQAVFIHLRAVLGVPFDVLILALVGLLVVNVVFGRKISFKMAVSVCCYALSVGVLWRVMGLALAFFGDPDNFNATFPTPTTPAFFLDPREISKPLYALAGSVDVFAFWEMALLAVGFSEASGQGPEGQKAKVNARSIFLILFGLWVVLASIGMGVAKLMS